MISNPNLVSGESAELSQKSRLSSGSRLGASLALVLLLTGCGASSVKQTWKDPAYTGGPLGKTAVLAVEERNLLRQALENRFRNQLEQAGQPSVVTHELLSLPEIKENRQTAAARLREAAAESLLIVRLVDSQTRNREVRATPALFAPVTTGYGTDYGYYGWYDYYTVAFMDMGTVWGSLEQSIYLESTLFDLKSGKRVWSGLTETVFKDNMDRLEEADVLVSKILAALRKDGLIR